MTNNTTQYTPMTIQDQGEAGFVILDSNGNFYARTYSSVDARLIAAAPMLLEALEMAEKALAKIPTSWGAAYELEKIRAAILQATAGSVRAARGESNG